MAELLPHRGISPYLFQLNGAAYTTRQHADAVERAGRMADAAACPVIERVVVRLLKYSPDRLATAAETAEYEAYEAKMWKTGKGEEPWGLERRVVCRDADGDIADVFLGRTPRGDDMTTVTPDEIRRMAVVWAREVERNAKYVPFGDREFAREQEELRQQEERQAAAKRRNSRAAARERLAYYLEHEAEYRANGHDIDEMIAGAREAVSG